VEVTNFLTAIRAITTKQTTIINARLRDKNDEAER